MFVRHVISGSSFRGQLPGILLAIVLSTGCSAPLKRASPGYNDVCLHLCSTGQKREKFNCGTEAVRQVIQYYRPDIKDEDISTDSLLFVEANDTVSLLSCLRDNIAIPLTMQNATLDGLFGSIASGDPVVVFLAGDAFRVGGFDLFGTLVFHCIVVVGHNAQETDLYFYSDGKGPYVISRKVFVREWARVDNLCIMRGKSAGCRSHPKRLIELSNIISICQTFTLSNNPAEESCL